MKVEDINPYWLNEDSRKFLERGNLQEGVTPEERIIEISKAAERISGIEGFGEKFLDYLVKGYYSLASPVWANFGLDRGLPISCNGVFVSDTIESIMGKLCEVAVQTKYGAGTSGYFGKIRPRGTPISTGGRADGPVHFMNLFEETTDVISQGSVRRGAFAGYLDIDSPDIMEFLEIRETGNSIQNMSIGVVIPDYWMKELVKEGDDLKSGAIKENEAQKLLVWARILRKRKETGYPYLFFTDTVNRNKPQVLKDKNIPIYASNLCSEIALPSSEEESFVCDLASMNVLHYEDWKDTDAVECLTIFLDTVMEEYIQKTANIKHMESSNRFARKWRAVGIGQLGWHSYLHKHSIPFESNEAMSKVKEIAKFIDKKSKEASEYMAATLGEPEGLVGYGVRNLTRTAIAPTTSSSFILGQVSPSIEPLRSNYFNKDLGKGGFTYKNPYLKEVLQSYDKDTREVWHSILQMDGSVQHLEFLSDHEKEVFKTFEEIVPIVLIQQAAIRQKYMDQSQSLNLMIPHNASFGDVSKLLVEGWKMGIKTFYYQRSSNPSQELIRDINFCPSCEA